MWRWSTERTADRAEAVSILLFCSCLLTPAVSSAQSIKLDGSLGSRTTLTGPAYTIPHDLGQTRGANLFHSFEQFNVLTGESATFTGPNTISRVISRVTGGVQSFIDGLLGTDFAGAKPEFYLVNPSGILFGGHASLNISGSVHFSTADYLRMVDDSRFYSRLGVNESMLSVEPVAAFGFLTNTPSPISVQHSFDEEFISGDGESLTVQPGETLSLVGGGIMIVGAPVGDFNFLPTISAPSGRIQLASVKSVGEVPVNLAAFDINTAGLLGEIMLSERAMLDVSSGINTSGSVVIRGGKLTLDGIIAADTFGNQNGALAAVDVRMSENITLSGGSLITANSSGPGQSANILVEAKTVTLEREAQIESTASGSASGGTITVTADALTLQGASISAATSGPGAGGTITVTANTVTLGGHGANGQEQSGLLADAKGFGSGAGSAGDIVVSAQSLAIEDGAVISATSSGAGAGGTITLSTQSMMVTRNGQIRTSNSGTGLAGAITVQATEAIQIGGNGSLGQTGLFSQTGADGDGGQISVTAPRLVVAQGGAISATGTGLRGTVSLNVGTVTVEPGGVIDGFGPGLQQGELSLDGSLGPAGPLTGPRFQIGAELGQIRGSNLFHSFSRFRLLSGEEAAFTGPSAITAIIARITGGEPSLIEGRLRADIPGAELFLINPSGIIFGPNARLNVSGSFHASTADNLILTDHARFYASLDLQESTLSAQPVAAFGFLDRAQYAALTINQGSLQVPTGKTLALVGGSLDLNGLSLSSPPTLKALSGRVELVSVASAGEVPAVRTVDATAPSLDAFAALGAITLNNRASVVASADTTAGTPGGQVVIRGGRLTVDNRSAILASTAGNANAPVVALDIAVRDAILVDHSSVLSAPNNPGSFTSVGTGHAGAIELRAATLEVNTRASLFANYSTNGNGADLRIRVGSFLLTGGATVELRNLGSGTSGNGGTLDIQASQNMMIGARSTIKAENFRGQGAGAAVLITTPELVVEGGPSAGQGSGITAITGGNGPASSVVLSISTLELRGGQASIDTRTRDVSVTPAVPPQFGGGPIIVQGLGGASTAAELVSVSGRLSGFLTETEGNGAGGRLSVTTNQLVVTDQARISANTLGSGQAGTVALNVNVLDVQGGGRIDSSTTGASTDPKGGSGGMIDVRGVTGEGSVADMVMVSGQDPFGGVSRFLTETKGSGDGGTLHVRAVQVILSDGALVSATTSRSGAAGSITMNVDTLTVQGQAAITSSSTGTAAGSGKAGDLTILADRVVINGSGSQVSKLSTFSEIAQGGSLGIVSRELEITGNAVVTTETQAGAGGTLSIDAEQVMVSTGGRIETSSAGSGKAGALTLTATESLELSGLGASGPSRVSSVAGDGEAGQVIISAPTVQVVGGLIGSTPGKITPPDLLDRISSTLDTLGPTTDTAMQVKNGILDAYRSNEIFQEHLPKVSAALETLGPIQVALDEVTGSLPNRQSATQVVNRVLTGVVVPIPGTAVENTRQAFQRTVALETIALVLREANLQGISGGLPDKVINQLTEKSVTKAAARNVLNLILFDTGATPENVAGGSLQINAGTLAVTNGGELTTRTQGAGRGGTIRVDANQLVSVTESSRVTSQSTGTGDAGRVIVAAPSLVFDASDITTAAIGTGLAGDVVLRGANISLANTRVDSSTSGQTGGGTLTIIGSERVAIRGRQGLLSTSSTGDGPGGSIDLRGGQIELTNGATVSATSVGAGNAGDIRLTADQAILLQDSTITTRATAASGGDITLMAPSLIQLGDSRIESSVAGGTATKGGNILLDPQSVIIRNSQILANAVQGAGGNITIVGNVVMVDPLSRIDASSALGVSGQVAIQAPVNNVATALSRLSQQPLNASELLTARCSARLREGTTSSLTLAGRDGVPAEPGGWRPTAFVTAAYHPTVAPPALAARSVVTGLSPLVPRPSGPELHAMSAALPLPTGCGS